MNEDLSKARLNATRNVLVLLSGGIDSATCVVYYLELGLKVYALFVDYGQVPRKPERASAERIAAEFGVALDVVSVTGLPKLSGKIPGRNAALLVLALMCRPFQSGLIALGIHAGTQYEDCSPLFTRVMQEVFDVYTGGSVQVDAPFLYWGKAHIVQFARTKNIPLDITYSCEMGEEAPCRLCSSCRDRENL